MVNCRGEVPSPNKKDSPNQVLLQTDKNRLGNFRTMGEYKSYHRHSIRLMGYDYSRAGAYFMSICTQNHMCIFGDVVKGEMRLNEYGKTVQNEWLKTEHVRKGITLDTFVVMPNHFHGIIVIENSNDVGATRRVAQTRASHRLAPTLRGPKSNSIGAIVGQFKSIVTKNIWKLGFHDFHWQRNYYEHVIRNDNELIRVREYIMNNPLQWQFDKENSNRIENETYIKKWEWVEGKRK